MADKPIIFRPEMVQAILEGRKTMTRRKSDRYQVGDHLWVKETWATVRFVYDWEVTTSLVDTIDLNGAMPERFPNIYLGTPIVDKILHKARFDYDCHPDERGFKWRSPLFMPKWAARIWLEVTDVRKERLGDISEEDAVLEGFETRVERNEFCAWSIPALNQFLDYWRKLHGDIDYDEEVNVITFKVLEGKNG